MPVVYMILRILVHPEMLFPIGIAFFSVWTVFTVRDTKNNGCGAYTTYYDILSVMTLVFVVFLLLHLSYFTDVVFLEKGFKIRNTDLSETEFHLGIINNLKDMFFPLFPYTSGASFSAYHINMHLEIEMFNRLFSTDTLKLTFFYFPLLYFVLLVYVPYIFFHKYLKMRFLGVFAGVLIVVGSDLSFIPGLIGNFPSDMPWVVISAPVLWPLFSLNGFLPSMFIMFLCLLYLKRFYDDGNVLNLLVFGILGFSAYGFKSSVGFHIMSAAFITGIASIAFHQDGTKGKIVCTISALAVLAMVMELIVFREEIGNYMVKIDPFNRFFESLKYFGITRVSGPLYFLLFPVYSLATLGIRSLSFYLLGFDFRKHCANPIVIFLIIFVISGFLLSEFIFIGSPISACLNINNAMWFSFQSLMTCWVLFFIMVSRLHERFRVILAIIVMFSLPSTMQFLSVRFTSKYTTIDSAAVDVIKYFESVPQGSIILHPLDPMELSLASNFSGKLDVLSLYKSNVDVGGLKEAEIVHRINDLTKFFEAPENDRTSILKKYKVDYIYAPTLHIAILDKEPMLAKVLHNYRYVIYKVEKI